MTDGHSWTLRRGLSNVYGGQTRAFPICHIHATAVIDKQLTLARAVAPFCFSVPRGRVPPAAEACQNGAVLESLLSCGRTPDFAQDHVHVSLGHIAYLPAWLRCTRSQSIAHRRRKFSKMLAKTMPLGMAAHPHHTPWRDLGISGHPSTKTTMVPSNEGIGCPRRIVNAPL
jgi:hypothetical protein